MKFKVGDKVKIPKTKSKSYPIKYFHRNNLENINYLIIKSYDIDHKDNSYVYWCDIPGIKYTDFNEFGESDLELYEEPKQQNMKKDKTAILTLETAKLMYKSSDEGIKQFALNNYSKEELESKELPKSWEELESIRGSYVNNDSVVINNIIKRNVLDHNKNLFPTESLAKGVLALAQLLQLRNAWWNGWESKYGVNFKKYFITFNFEEKELEVCMAWKYNNLFVFQTKELAEQFKDTFSELLFEARELI